MNIDQRKFLMIFYFTGDYKKMLFRTF